MEGEWGALGGMWKLRKTILWQGNLFLAECQEESAKRKMKIKTRASIGVTWDIYHYTKPFTNKCDEWI